MTSWKVEKEFKKTELKISSMTRNYFLNRAYAKPLIIILSLTKSSSSPSGDLRRWLRENWPHFSTSKLRHLWGKNVHVFHKNSVRYEAKLLGNSNISLNFDSILRQVCGKNIICFMESYASHERNLPHLFKQPPPGLIEIYKFSLNFQWILRQVCGKT